MLKYGRDGKAQVIATIGRKGTQAAKKPRLPSKRGKGFIPPSEPVQWRWSDGNWIEIIIPCLPPSKNCWKGLHPLQIYRLWYAPWTRWVKRSFPLDTTGFWDGGDKVNISISLQYPDHRQRDRLNLVSFPPLLDALCNLKVLADDSDKVIADLYIPAPRVVPGKPQTHIEINLARAALPQELQEWDEDVEERS